MLIPGFVMCFLCIIFSLEIVSLKKRELVALFIVFVFYVCLSQYVLVSHPLVYGM